ncbi:hypothetical protein GALL_550290 [mine drainage metagenome]|uniref:Uncharacterized protein n=1 Tax=mine drainage metagenome TaxID=410659 RepID=A0A1J5NXD5_9ZZZZ
MLAYFIRNFLVPEIRFNPKPLILQRFGDTVGILGLRIGDIEHHDLHRRQPNRQGTCRFFNQDADKTFQAANNSAM